MKAAAERAAELICEWSGAKVVGAVEIGETNSAPGYEVDLEWDMLDNMIGSKLDRTHVKSILGALDIEVRSESKKGMNLMVSAYRSDEGLVVKRIY